MSLRGPYPSTKWGTFLVHILPIHLQNSCTISSDWSLKSTVSLLLSLITITQPQGIHDYLLIPHAIDTAIVIVLTSCKIFVDENSLPPSASDALMMLPAAKRHLKQCLHKLINTHSFNSINYNTAPRPPAQITQNGALSRALTLPLL